MSINGMAVLYLHLRRLKNMFFKNSKNELELLLLISILGSQKRFGNWRNQS